jgi:cystathionine beta-lyase/cystathionine gamma-synthase
MQIAKDRSIADWSQAGPLIRLSIGLEDAADLWHDLETFVKVLTYA